MRQTLKSVVVFTIGLALACSMAGCGREILARAVFTVEGMHCDGCSAAIVDALTATPGVEKAFADYQEGVAEVVYRPRRVDVDELKAEIEKLGYTVTGMVTEAVEG